MANTTNFNWETPDDTDLVKDGAAAMRTLGNSIDTSFVDLKGGTTGQILSKASNTDLDYTWVTTDDANAIQNAIVDAKGDLIAATAADTPARLAVGTNGQVLTADSSAGTGLAYTNKGWTLISTTSLSGASVTLSSIPQTYQSLKLVVKGMNNATADGKFSMQCNGATSGHFLSGQELTTNYSVNSFYFQSQGNMTRANSDNIFVFDFDLYYDTFTEKSIGAKYFYVGAPGDTSGSAFGMFYNPGAAISSIKLLNTGGNLSAGTALLYGVA